MSAAYYEERVQYLALHAEALASSPLGEIEEWIKAGVAPPASSLRAAGLTRFSRDHFASIEDYFAAMERMSLARSAFIRLFGFSIPCAEAIEALRGLGPIVEVGAGTGYWSALLQAAGLDVIGTDANVGASGYGFRIASRHPLVQMSAAEAVVAYPNRDVFCSWPAYDEPWALAAVRKIQPGRHFAYIGEGRGGCTGTDGLFHYLSTRFDEVEQVAIPQFPGLNDWLTIYRRRA